MNRQVEAFLRKIAHDPGDAQITSHCPFCGSGQIVGRSDGNIECEFCGMTYLVRVQPMFTGMPGNPMGPGFGGDTSMAPDLMAPGLLGPDGQPMMGEPGMEETPGMEEQDAAMMMGGGPAIPGGPGAMMDGLGPEGEDGEGEPGEEGSEAEDGENPFAGSDAEDGSGDSGGEKKPSDKKSDSKPPKSKKKDKGNKKEGARTDPDDISDEEIERLVREHFADGHQHPGDKCPYDPPAPPHPEYQHPVPDEDKDWYSWDDSSHGPGFIARRARSYRTIAGDELPEDAFIRHLAVLHGGIEVVRRAS